MSALAASFTRECAAFLRDVHLPRLVRALQTLPAGDLWWRPHERALSVGAILRHLEGNVRQWILSGLGGAPDARERSAEFAGAERASAAELLARLQETVRAAAATIEALDEARLLASLRIQGFEVSGLHAVLHVVEHFSWHTGEAVWIAKARAGAGHGLAFYDDAALEARRGDDAALEARRGDDAALEARRGDDAALEARRGDDAAPKAGQGADA